MTSLMLQCKNCGKLFSSGIMFEPGASATFINSRSQCTFCGSMENIPDGVFKATVEGFIRILAQFDDPLKNANELFETLQNAKTKKDLIDVKKSTKFSKFKKWLPDSPEKFAAYVAIIATVIQLLSKSQNVKIEYNNTFVERYNQIVNIDLKNKFMTRTWFTSTNINHEHAALPIRQIYLWFITSDKKIPIVAGSSGNFQFPGGKPIEGETHLDTIKREMFEETGIRMDYEYMKPVFFGYYLIEDDLSWDGKPYLHIRYYVKVNKVSDEFELSTNEKEDDKDQMHMVKFADLLKLSEDINWVKGREEYNYILEQMI